MHYFPHEFSVDDAASANLHPAPACFLRYVSHFLAEQAILSTIAGVVAVQLVEV